MRHLLLLLLLTATTVFGSSNHQTLFILDGSGSMWGRVDGKAKIEVAQKVMTDLIADLPDDARVGLMAYGHRRKGDCEDIEMLSPLGPLERDRLTNAVNGIVPKGKTPITASVKLAVEQVRQIEGSVSIVLVSDGRESCDGDPCEAVRAAKQAGVDFRLHAIGFDLGEDGTKQLECMAKAGDGKYFAAANAEELAGALKQAVEARPGLILEVTSNGKPTPARVFLYRKGSDEEVLRDTLGHSPEKDNPLRLELEPGSYDLKVAPRELDGNPVRMLSDILIPEEGDIKRRVDFSDGTLQLIVTTNGKPLKARTYVYQAGTETEVARSRTDADGVAQYQLEPADYRVKIRPDGIDAPDRFIEDVTVTASETTTREIDFGSGSVELTVTTNGKPLKARTYILHAENGKEAARDRTDADGVARYSIPTGKYRIKVRPDGIDAPDQFIEDVTVTASEMTKREIDFGSGSVEITVTTNGKPLKARTYILHADNGKEAARDRTDADGVARYSIPTGKYRIKVRPDGIDAPDQFIDDVTVTADETTRKSHDIASGKVELTVTYRGDPLKARTYIQYADSGKEAARDRTNDEGLASYAVPTGKYRIKIRPDGIDAADHYLKEVVVEAGEITRSSFDFAKLEDEE